MVPLEVKSCQESAIQRAGSDKCYLDNVGPLESKKNKKIDLTLIAAEIHRTGHYYLGRLMPMQFTD